MSVALPYPPRKPVFRFHLLVERGVMRSTGIVYFLTRHLRFSSAGFHKGISRKHRSSARQSTALTQCSFGNPWFAAVALNIALLAHFRAYVNFRAKVGFPCGVRIISRQR